MTYGAVITQHNADGTVVVLHAPERIGVTREVLDNLNPAAATVAADGVLTFCREYVYRPVDTDLDGRVVVFERVA